jgi:hypothetical protein
MLHSQTARANHPNLIVFKETRTLPETPRTNGRRAGDKERAHLRRLELSIRNFIAHYEDHPEERFAPRTQALVKESREVFKELDALRSKARNPQNTQ